MENPRRRLPRAPEDTLESVAHEVKAFLISRFLPGQPLDAIDDSTQLLDEVLDSLSVVKLVTFVEERWQIEITPSEIDKNHFGALPVIAKLVIDKLHAK